MESEPERPGADEDDESDPYQDVCRAFQPGLLITVNDSDPTSDGFSEMEVMTVNEDTGEVILEERPETMYRISFTDRTYPEYDGPVIRELTDSEFAKRVEKLTTIEIIGIA